MPSTRKPPAQLTGYLVEALRHVAEVGSRVAKTLDGLDAGRVRASGQAFELIPRPFGRWCDGRALAMKAGRGPVRRSSRARKQVKR